MIQAIRRHQTRRRATQAGFTLIELLVVIVILGILAAVVVFAVSGTGDKGKAAAYAIDARTIRTAEEAFCAQFGRYGEADELVTGGFLSELPTYHQVGTGFADTPGTGCPGSGDLSKAAFFITCQASQEGCGGGGALAMSWKEQDAGVPSGVNLAGVHFRDRQTGWVVGDWDAGLGSMTIRRTTDGGQTWATQTYTPPSAIAGFEEFDRVHDVDFVDGDPLATARGWAVTEFGAIVQTTNGGDTWSVQLERPDFAILSGIDVVDANNAWAVGGCCGSGSVVMHWNGTNWTDQTVPTPNDSMADVQFLDTSRGVAVGFSLSTPPFNNVMTTVDGGATWVARSTPTAATLLGVSCITSEKCWATGVSGGRVFTTDDGGATWSPQVGVGSDASGISCVNQRQCWASMSGGVVPQPMFATLDGGVTWTKQQFVPVTASNAVDFVDIAHGWATAIGRDMAVYGPPLP